MREEKARLGSGFSGGALAKGGGGWLVFGGVRGEVVFFLEVEAVKDDQGAGVEFSNLIRLSVGLRCYQCLLC